MLPVLISIGPLAISSFGFFLALAFLYGSFLVWRLARAWDLPEEKVLDLILLTFFGGLIGARLFFVSLNLDFFSQNLLAILLITKYPGLNFWGGLLGGWLTLFYLARRLNLSFWQVADLAAIGFLGGLILGDIGCFLGGCGVGVASNAFFATPVVGVVGKRFPIQILEAIMVAIILAKLWKSAIKFHFQGKIAGLALISLGLVKLILEFLRMSPRGFPSFGGQVLSLVTVVLGLFIFYSLSRRNIWEDITSLTDSRSRKAILVATRKNWYNQRIIWALRLKRIKASRILRRINVKPTPKDIQ